MANLLVDERDTAFVLFEQLEVGDLCNFAPYQELSQEIFEMALKGAEKLAVKEIMPTNVIGDREGLVRKGDEVMVPKAFHRTWKLYKGGGWLAMCAPPDVGGQGMPWVLGVACDEFFQAANCSFSHFFCLTRSAARLIEKYGTPRQKEKYMVKMFSGEWTGTLCATEPQAGSDLGILKTSAKRNPDGTFSITGTKMFITVGSNDLEENIVHAVLARIEGAPAGIKGISTFIVPKYRVNDDGTLGKFNDIHLGGIEHKMGMHASPTCLLNFGDEGKCIGELLGEENRGIENVLIALNKARLEVGVQGLAVASAGYLHALKYAKERIQGQDIKEFRNPEADRVPIIRHPDVRRMLMFMKSLVEGIRAMSYFTAYCGDRARIASGEAERNKWEGFVRLLTPVAKAYSGDMGFRIVEMAMQVHGGYGYIREYPIEQFLRDNKIITLYEGANGIQALDLVARKLGMDKGIVFTSFLEEVSQFIEATKGHEAVQGEIKRLESSKNAVAEVAMFFASKAREDLTIPALYAIPFLDLFGDMIVGWQLLWQATIAHRKLQALLEEKGAPSAQSPKSLALQNRDAAYYYGKIAAAKFFANTFLTLSPAKAQVIMNADESALDIPDASFASG